MNNRKPGRPPDIYLIDACWRGNALRLYFGSSVEEIYGDDWDDIPYESNCGTVYSEYVTCVLDVLIPFNYTITDIADDLYYGNSKYCRNDFKDGNIALIWCVDRNHERENVYFYMGEKKWSVIEKLKSLGAATQIIRKDIKGDK